MGWCWSLSSLLVGGTLPFLSLILMRPSSISTDCRFLASGLDGAQRPLQIRFPKLQDARLIGLTRSRASLRLADFGSFDGALQHRADQLHADRASDERRRCRLPPRSNVAIRHAGLPFLPSTRLIRICVSGAHAVQ